MAGEDWISGPWFLATGCSWRRILQAGTDAPVIVPTTSQHDRHPDLMGGDANLTLAAAAPRMYAALKAATRELIGERDCLFESVSLPDGTIPDGEDKAGIAEMDRVINECQAAMAEARGEN